MSKKIIYLAFLLYCFHLTSMDSVKLPVFTIAQRNVAIFDSNQFQQHYIEYPVTTWPWLSEYYLKKNIGKTLSGYNNNDGNQKPILFASENLALFALHHIAQNPTQFSALILQNPKHLDERYTISELHTTIPTTIPVLFVDLANQPTKCTTILYAKMHQRVKNKTFLIQSLQAATMQQNISDILSFEILGEHKPGLTKSFCPDVTSETLQKLKGIKQAEILRYFKNSMTYIFFGSFITYLFLKNYIRCNAT